MRTILVEKISRVTLIGINRPEKRNALNLVTQKILCEEIKNFENDPDSDIAVLHGIGGNFCSGYDLNEIIENPNFFHEKTLPNRFIVKPMIAAINGYAVGAGMELALMCDLRVMEESAIMGFFNRRFGVPTIDGGTTRLQKLIGASAAMDLILTGRGLHAKEALERGLLARLVACGTALGQSINLAQSIGKFPQASLNVDRKSVYYSTFEATNFEDALQHERMGITPEITVEARKGANKFVEGIGKHGKSYNIYEKIKKDWEI